MVSIPDSGFFRHEFSEEGAFLIIEKDRLTRGLGESRDCPQTLAMQKVSIKRR